MTESLRDRQRAQIRADIRRAAFRLFIERGYDAVTTEEIASANYPRIRITSSSGSFVKASGRGWVESELTERGVFSLAVSAVDGAVYAGTEPSRLFRSEDGGDSWEELKLPPQGPGAQRCAHAAVGSTYFLFHYTGLSSNGQELMNIWNDMDRGAVKQDDAFQQADEAVRKKAGSLTSR